MRQLPTIRRALTLSAMTLSALCVHLVSAVGAPPSTSTAPQSDEQGQATPRAEQEETEALVTCDLEAIKKLKPHQTLLHVQGMVCGMCVQGITKLLSALEGVKSVEIELEAGAVLITTEERTQLSDGTLKDAITRAGYQLQDVHRPVAQ